MGPWLARRHTGQRENGGDARGRPENSIGRAPDPERRGHFAVDGPEGFGKFLDQVLGPLDVMSGAMALGRGIHRSRSAPDCPSSLRRP